MADFMPAAVARRNQKIAIGFQKILTNQSKSLKNMIKAGESSDHRNVEKNILLRCNLPLVLLTPFITEMMDALKMAKDEKIREDKFKREERQFLARLKEKTESRPKMSINKDALRIERAQLHSASTSHH